MKRKVSQELFDNMKKYMSDAQLEKYNVCTGVTDPSAIELIKEYYNKNLPVDVYSWRQVNHFLNHDELIDEQIDFITNNICNIFYSRSPERVVSVIGTHIVNDEYIFPIYSLDFSSSFGLKMTVCSKEKEWLVSVETRDTIQDLECKWHFDLGNEVENAKGHLPNNKIFKAFEEKTKKFTSMFESKYDFYAFCIYLKEELSFKG